MNSILNIAFTLFILLIIACCAEQISIDNKFTPIIRPAISAMIIITIISGASKINFNETAVFFTNENAIGSDEVWESARINTEQFLKEDMLKLCKENFLNVFDIDVQIERNFESFTIKRIDISGPDKLSAKNLISGHYNVGLAYIFIDGET